MTEQARRPQFGPDAGEVYRWQQTARDFVLAANYLIDWHDPPREAGEAADLSWLHSGSAAPLMALYATAVENLLKAILVARGESLVANGRLRPQFGHHRLVEYAAGAGIEPTAEVTELLRRLSHVAYAGSDPAPDAPGGQRGASSLDYPADVERIWSLLEQLEELLRATGAPCLPGVDLRARYRPHGYEVVERS